MGDLKVRIRRKFTSSIVRVQPLALTLATLLHKLLCKLFSCHIYKEAQADDFALAGAIDLRIVLAEAPFYKQRLTKSVLTFDLQGGGA